MDALIYSLAYCLYFYLKPWFLLVHLECIGIIVLDAHYPYSLSFSLAK